MMISHEQAARAAAELLSGIDRIPSPASTSVPEDVLEAALSKAVTTPEVRADRVLHARHLLDDGLPDALTIAESILHRTLGDAVR